jgi:hypothetical protein
MSAGCRWQDPTREFCTTTRGWSFTTSPFSIRRPFTPESERQAILWLKVVNGNFGDGRIGYRVTACLACSPQFLTSFSATSGRRVGPRPGRAHGMSARSIVASTSASHHNADPDFGTERVHFGTRPFDHSLLLLDDCGGMDTNQTISESSG